MPLDESGTTYRSLILQAYPDLKIEHVHHAGNSSGVVDGAAALLLASPEYARAHGLKPRARVVAMANMGDSPELMLNAPGPAARKVLAKAGLDTADIDLWEINEAFAVVPEKFIRDLDLDREKVNVNGGAIALGHPIGATGAMLIGAVLDELERRGLQRGLVTMCAGRRHGAGDHHRTDLRPAAKWPQPRWTAQNDRFAPARADLRREPARGPGSRYPRPQSLKMAGKFRKVDSA